MHLPHLLRSGPLLARFFRAGDRVAHEIGIAVPRSEGDSDPAIEFIPLLSSVEGSPHDDWPPSPAFQHLHVERLEGREIVMLIGKTGKGHWSAAVEATTSGCLEFDVACRCLAPPPSLGSTYRLTDGTAHSAEVTVMPRVECEALDGALRSYTVAPSAANRISPAATSGPYPATLRWKYCIVTR